MVDYRARARRIEALRAATGLAYEPFGELAGVSGAAMHKACETGRIDETTAAALIAGLRRASPTLKADLAELMYGPPTLRIGVEADLDRVAVLQIRSSLPPQHRDTWIDIGRVLLKRYATEPPTSPFAPPKTSSPIRPGRRP